MVKAAVGVAGGRYGKCKVAAAWVCRIGFGKPVDVPDVWWMYAIVELVIASGVIYRLAVCDTGISSRAWCLHDWGLDETASSVSDSECNTCAQFVVLRR